MRHRNWNLLDSRGNNPQGVNAGVSRRRDQSYSRTGSKGWVSVYEMKERKR